MNNSEKKLFNKLLEEARDLAEANNRPIGIYLDKKIKEIASGYIGNPTQQTKEQYRKIYNRLLSDPKNKNKSASIILMNAGSKASFDLYRTAFRFCISEDITKLRLEAEKCRQNKDYEGMTEKTKMAFKLAVVFQYQFLSHEKITFSDVKTQDNFKKKVNSKKKGLKKLIEYSDLINSLSAEKAEKYFMPVSIYGLFGVRPAELQKGIALVAEESEGKKVIYGAVKGAKVSKNKGQETRYCKVFLDDSNPTDMKLYDHIISNGGKLSYTQERENYESLRKLMSRNFNGASPYSYRHRVASDLKASGLSKTTIAMFLGHANDKSQSHYGYKQNGKSRGLSAQATNEVREVASNYGDYTEKKERTQKFKTRLEAAKSGFSGAEGSHTAKKWKIGK